MCLKVHVWFLFLLLCDISCWPVKLKNAHIDFAESLTCEINTLKDSSQVALWSFRWEMDHSSICNRPSVKLFNQTWEAKVKSKGGWDTLLGPWEWTNWLRKEPQGFAICGFLSSSFSPFSIEGLSITAWPYLLYVHGAWVCNKVWRGSCAPLISFHLYFFFLTGLFLGYF